MAPVAFSLMANIFFNLIGHRSKRQLFCVLIGFYLTIRTYFKKKQKLKQLQKLKHIKIKNQPLITFSGGGQLSFYYQGICAYLRDNFNLDDVRFAGISAGSSAAASLASQLPTEASMIFGLRWFKMILDRQFKMFLLPPSTFIQTAVHICKEFGITDEWIQAQSERRDYYYGVTNFSVFPPKHELVTNFESSKESFYAMSCSMRVLPFFRTPGYYRNMLVLDGGFSAIFSVPLDADPNKIIRITPSSILNADINPDYYSSNTFKWIDVFKLPNLECLYQQFERGYNDAIRCRSNLIAKGLKLKSKQNGGGYHNNLELHMKLLKSHGKQIFANTNIKGLKKQDFSHFLPDV